MPENSCDSANNFYICFKSFKIVFTYVSCYHFKIMFRITVKIVQTMRQEIEFFKYTSISLLWLQSHVENI